MRSVRRNLSIVVFHSTNAGYTLSQANITAAPCVQWQLIVIAAQVAELEVQLARVTARLQALEAAAGLSIALAGLLAPNGGAADAAGTPDGLWTPQALSLAQGAGEQAPLALLVFSIFWCLASSCTSVSRVLQAAQRLPRHTATLRLPGVMATQVPLVHCWMLCAGCACVFEGSPFALTVTVTCRSSRLSMCHQR